MIGKLIPVLFLLGLLAVPAEAANVDLTTLPKRNAV